MSESRQSGRGYFISLEGPDGGGKTTAIFGLVEKLRNLGLSIVQTREPGGTPIGEQIRNLIVDLRNVEMCDRTEQLLFQAARAQHVGQVIKPKLDAGEVVVCDRFADSTLAYGGYGFDLNIDELGFLINFATVGLKPDLTFLLDIPAEVGLERRRLAGGENRLDVYNLPFHQKVRDGYLKLAQLEPERWVVVDAMKSPENVLDYVYTETQKRLRAIGMLALV